MAKYYKFYYSAGYVGCDENVVFKFSDSTSEEEIEKAFNDWYQSVDTSFGNFYEISEKEAEKYEIDEDYMED